MIKHLTKNQPDEQSQSIEQLNVQLPWVVVGGGMVGAAMALALAEAGRKVVVLEPYPETEFDPTGEYDLRISAVTADNIALLDALGVWPQVAGSRVQEFVQLAVREEGGDWLQFGADTELSGKSLHQPAGSAVPLGYMVENKALQWVLTERLKAHDRVIYRTEGFAKIARANESEDAAWNVVTDTGEYIPYQFLIGADGISSRVRNAVGIGTAGASYQERCLLATVSVAEEIPAATWQTFCGREVHALLPLANQQACLIVYADTAEIKGWQKNNVEAELFQRFGGEIGAFTLKNFGSFPLKHQHALRYYEPSFNALVIGDAAHGVHPLAGQGVNLGLRDVAAVRNLVRKFTDDNAEFVVKLQQVLKQRQIENALMGQGLDSIARIFRSEHPFLQVARRSAFSVLARTKKLRSMVGRFAGASLSK
ncbi:Ubiquinone biosynthesis hydroxylase, UbiH/UbiF/VisC/COQ6 family [Idiomarina sp. A28L]|uniref:FAD-dependent oxidoreductase n=1 Tax=Idiomarina sp. A28L TaxID=1036674 RepID=UPI0002138737|nr:FAD-dependent oxidoreductase [Idiomarina sp. A28L]EGN76400.1 Ubiquinone biosynthesis hydroxylase, UbiH/UbiF/VisC/COQ6 family [Idiomarina sp. A28L]